jgi:hypothetical protein
MNARTSNTLMGLALPNIPWEERPDGSCDVVWRYMCTVLAQLPVRGAHRRADRAYCHLLWRRRYRHWTGFRLR